MARLPDTFEAEPVGPQHPIGAEIDQLRTEFVALGINPDHAVPLWIGKPDRFTGVVMTSAKQVLDFFRAELTAQRAVKGQQAPGSEPPAQQPLPDYEPAPAGTITVGYGDDRDSALAQVASEGSKAQREFKSLAKRQREAAVRAASEAWRTAVAQRAEAMRQWNAYVEARRAEFHRVRDNP